MNIVDPILRFLPWLVFGQGLFLSIAVASRWKHASNRNLGLFLFFLSIHGLIALAWQDPAGRRLPEISVLFSCLPFLYGPLMYRYVWYSLYRDWKDSVPFAVHAIPALVNFFIYGMIYLTVGRETYGDIAREVFAGRGPVYVIAIEYAKVVHGILYAILIIRLLRRNNEAIKRWAAEKQRRLWLRALAAAFALSWTLVLVSAVLLWSPGFPEDLNLLVIALQLVAFLAFLYMVAFFALRYPSVLNPREIREAIRRKLNLPEGFVDETLRRLKVAEEQEFYVNPEVTLPSLAQSLGLHPNALSYIVNEESGVGFREYLNNLRLEWFLRIAADNPDRKSNLEMAFAAGFSSKTTFLRAFRTRFSTTPVDYLSKFGTDSHTGGTGTHTGTP